MSQVLLRLLSTRLRWSIWFSYHEDSFYPRILCYISLSLSVQGDSGVNKYPQDRDDQTVALSLKPDSILPPLRSCVVLEGSPDASLSLSFSACTVGVIMMLFLQPASLNILYLESVCLPGGGQRAVQKLQRAALDLLSPADTHSAGNRASEAGGCYRRSGWAGSSPPL